MVGWVDIVIIVRDGVSGRSMWVRGVHGKLTFLNGERRKEEK